MILREDATVKAQTPPFANNNKNMFNCIVIHLSRANVNKIRLVFTIIYRSSSSFSSSSKWVMYHLAFSFTCFRTTLPPNPMKQSCKSGKRWRDYFCNGTQDSKSWVKDPDSGTRVGGGVCGAYADIPRMCPFRRDCCLCFSSMHTTVFTQVGKLRSFQLCIIKAEQIVLWLSGAMVRKLYTSYIYIYIYIS